MINKKYTISKLLGRGRSSVYLCEDNMMRGKNIAIKILPESTGDEEVKLFLDEFFTLRKLNHPNIIKTFETGTVTAADAGGGIETGSKYFTLEYFDGTDLLKFDEINDEKILKSILKQICSALYYLHLSNYIYYDLKPENILISLKDGKPQIKLIDLGFAQYIVNNAEPTIRGTAEYIAPEILRNDKHDFRVDFYSLGIMLYRLLFKRFPFDTSSELEIYKAQIEQEFEIPGTGIPESIVAVIKKLLKKNPDERYSNALQILSDLGIEPGKEDSEHWMPAKVFAGRKDSLTILKTYIADSASREVFTVKGSEGAGKTTLAFTLYRDVENSVLIDDSLSLSGAEFISFILNKITYSEFVFPKLSAELLKRIDLFNTGTLADPVSEFKSIINLLTSECNFTIIFDSFNSYDSFAIEILKNIIPIFQVNHIRVILTENSDKQSLSDTIANLREINLTPFTEAQLNEYLNKSFASYFPKDQLRQLIISHADLLPGSLESFIKDLILLDVIQFKHAGIGIITDEKSSAALKSSHEDLYKIRTGNLNDKELSAARFLSAFEIPPVIQAIGKYLSIDENETIELFHSLFNKNIIHDVSQGANPVFTSEGLKKHIYSTIAGKKNYHSGITAFLGKNYPEFNKHELARQFELADSFEESYNLLKEELSNAEKISAFSFQKAILQHILTFPLNNEKKLITSIEYCDILVKLNDYQSALDLAEELLQDKISDNIKNDLLVLKSKCLTGLGNLDEGKELLKELIKSSRGSEIRNLLLLDLANVNLSLNNYDEVKNICSKLTGSKKIEPEIIGSAYQLLGLVSIYKDNNLDEALEFFIKADSAYESGNLKFRQAGILMNIGNIYSMRGDDENAVTYWQQSLSLNQSIGNIQQEARLLINFGIYYFNLLEFDKSTDNYSKAFSIFNSLGILDGQGLVESNLGEIFLLMCEYQKSFDYLNEAISIFRQLQNKDEELQAIFLLGKLYFTIGDFEKLNILLKEFEYKIQDDEGEINKINHQYLCILSKIPGGNLSSLLQLLTEFRTRLSPDERKYDYLQCTMVIIDMMIKLNVLDEAAAELQSEVLSGICSGNYLFEAERLYRFGIICEKNSLLGSKSAVDYYLEACEMLTNLHITELTWKVLYALFKVYNRRGILNKSREYEKYTRSLLDFITGNISDRKLRNKYLDDPERKEALKELSYYEEQF